MLPSNPASTPFSPQPPPRLLDVATVAKRLGVSVRTVRREIKNGRLRAYRVGRLLRVGEDDLLAYLDSRRHIIVLTALSSSHARR